MEDQQAPDRDWRRIARRIAAAVVGALLLVAAPLFWLVSVILSEEGWDTNEPLRTFGTVIAGMILITAVFAFPQGKSRGLGLTFWALAAVTAILVIAWIIAHQACTSCGIP